MMQTSAVANIRIFLKSKNKSEYRFHKDTGLSKGYLSRVTSMTDISLRMVHAAYPTLNMHWVVTGEGPMEFI
ncbi:MAG: hypothetical protein ABJH98_17800 [Reichenbachiella sp.]|uniref:hypothetical protein n=1 Tax=Reichenbachiella sp. TaxID=2184521 RepID=UPI003264300A